MSSRWIWSLTDEPNFPWRARVKGHAHMLEVNAVSGGYYAQVMVAHTAVAETPLTRDLGSCKSMAEQLGNPFLEATDAARLARKGMKGDRS